MTAPVEGVPASRAKQWRMTEQKKETPAGVSCYSTRPPTGSRARRSSENGSYSSESASADSVSAEDSDEAVSAASAASSAFLVRRTLEA